MIMPNDPADASHSLPPTRPSLLFRLRDWQDAASWEEFYRLYQRLVTGLARRAGLNHVEAEEVTQDVFRRVAETIHDFESNPQRGSFRGWLMNLTRWRITDKFRERQRNEKHRAPHRDGSTDEGTRTIERVADTGGSAHPWADSALEDAEWQRHVLEAALARLARRVPAKHFQAFELYHRQGWTVLRVSRELGLNPATVYVINHRLTKQLKSEVERLSAQLN
jgi:RNA polymerase sigma factor (sigma-70 family)